jgi:hypothetical protein
VSNSSLLFKLQNTTTTGIAGHQQTNPQGSNTATNGRMGAVLVEHMMTFCSRRFIDIADQNSVPQFDTYKEKSCWLTGMYKAVMNTNNDCRERGIRTTKAEIHKALINKIRTTNHSYRAAALKTSRVERRNGREVIRRVATDDFLSLGKTSAQAWLDTYGDILRKPGRQELSRKRRKAVPHYWTRTIRYMRTKETNVRVLQDIELPEALRAGTAVGDDHDGGAAVHEEGGASDDGGSSSDDDDEVGSSSDDDDEVGSSSQGDHEVGSSSDDDSSDDDDIPKRKKKKQKDKRKKNKMQEKRKIEPVFGNLHSDTDDDILDDIEDSLEDPELPRLRGYGEYNNQRSTLMEDGSEEQGGIRRGVGGQGHRGRGGGRGDSGRGSRGRGRQHACGHSPVGRTRVGTRKREMTATQDFEVGPGRSTRLRSQTELMSQAI